MFEDILLESEQVELLNTLVELSRKMPRHDRSKFIVAQSNGGDFLLVPGHSSASQKIFMGDVEILARVGLVDISYPSSSPNVNVLPRGYAYYGFLKRQSGQPVEHIEHTVRNYLVSESFRQKYPLAYNKWAEAEEILWGSDSDFQLTTIGHLCREAIQEFTANLVEQYKPGNAPADKTRTVASLRSILDQQKAEAGSAEMAFLEALLAYWGTVNDLIQRQEHGGQKEGSPLVWEDGRRAVFQTALVMFEVDRSIGPGT